MKYSDNLVTRYAKKILGFAYSKTRNVFQAEDLAQEILLQLVKTLPGRDDITDLNGFVYTVCCYTWAKFLRGNKRHWQNLNIDDFSGLQNGMSIEEDAEKADLLERLRAEVTYLSRLHRQITVMFYYEEKSVPDIASVLKVPIGTVYWHLSEIRRKIREGIEMQNTSLSVKPQRLMFGIWGCCFKDVGLGYEYTLANSVVIACYGKALSIEEIARTLSVSAAYLESVIENLVLMDYLKVVNRNRYTTNMFELYIA